MQIAPLTFAVGCFAHDALVLKTEALIKVTCAGVVFIDVEKKPMCAKFAKGDAHQFSKDATAESALGHGYDDTLELDGAGFFADATQNGVSLYLARFCFADVVAGVAACERSSVALLAPLTDKLTRERCALWREWQGCHPGSRGGEAWVEPIVMRRQRFDTSYPYPRAR